MRIEIIGYDRRGLLINRWVDIPDMYVFHDARSDPGYRQQAYGRAAAQQYQYQNVPYQAGIGLAAQAGIGALGQNYPYAAPWEKEYVKGPW